MKTLSILYIFFIPLFLHAQSKQIENDSKMIEQLPSLDVLIDSAILYSPLLDAQYELNLQLKEELKIQKKNWTDYIYIEGSGRYGLYNQVTVSEVVTNDLTQSGLKLENEQFSYYAGMSVKLPLSAIGNKKNEKKIKELKISQAQFETKKLEGEISQLVIEIYYKLKSYEEIMQVSFSTFQTMEISVLKAQKDLENGRIEIDEFTRLVGAKGKAHEGYLQAKNNFYMMFKKLELITGLQF